jgi:spore coat polysaccharide biosynthesis predicted glycosyltransferase SpsG
VLHAAGGPGIGIGHLSRTRTLARALARCAPQTQVQCLWEGPGELLGRLATEGLDLVAAPDRPAALRARERLARGGPDTVLVSDLLALEDGYFLSARAEGFGTLVHINDSGRGRRQADLIVDEDPIPTPPPPGFRGSLLAGCDYRMIAEGVVLRRPSAPWCGTRATRLLLSLGGADPGGVSLELVDGLLGAGENRIEISVLKGPAFAASLTEALAARAAARASLTLAPPVDDIATLLLAHDLVVTLGGITSYEAMCLGVPVACVRYAHMGRYVERMAAEGLVLDLGESDAASGALLDCLGDGERLARVARTGFARVDGHGARRTARAILSLEGTAHPALD